MTAKRPPSRKGAPSKRRSAPSKRTPADRPVVVSRRTSRGASRTSGRRKTRTRTITRSVAPTFESRMWVLAEVATWMAAITFGLSITAMVAWVRARNDVASYLAAPREIAESTVWSAPISVQKGMPAHVDTLEADLLAAGYERVEHLLDSPTQGDATGVGVFALHDGTFDVWTALPAPIPGLQIDEGRVTIVVEAGHVARVSRTGGVVLPPTVLGKVGDPEASREPVQLENVSRWVEPALLSMEDARFRYHRGIDPLGILRALFSNATSEGQQGGSTLTQQLAKNLFLSQERTIRRKIREVFFAAALESKLTKDELLELYMSEVYLGQMAGLPLHGVEQAATAWFGKRAARLELHEAAMIVGVIPAPNTFSPVRHAEAALERRNMVLERMHELGEIDASQLERATQKPIEITGLAPSLVRRAPYAVDAAIERVEEELGEGITTKGIDVYTSIHPLYQRAAEEAVAAGMAKLDADYPKAAGAQVGLVAVRVGDGHVVAMVGGRDYRESAFNRATDASRQVGSTVKPLTVAKALYDQKVTPATRFADQPVSFDFGGEAWAPRNYDGKYEGEVTLRRAIEASRNIPAVHLARTVGMVRLGRFYRSAGLKSATGLPSAALGSFPASPLELAGAYTLFDHGVAHEAEVVDFVLDAERAVVWDAEPIARQVVDHRAAAQAMDLLRGVITSGTGARARSLGVTGNAGGKTGTTDEYRDAWFAGLTPELSVAVWVGNDKGTLGLSGSRAALPTWAHFIATSGTQDRPVVIPDGLERVKICAASGQRARNACDDVLEELFVVGSSPDQKCEEHGAEKGLRNFFGKLFKRKNRQNDPSEGVVGAPEAPSPRGRRRDKRDKR